MRLGITLKQHSYTPEAFAYQKYLEKKGWKIQLAYEDELDPYNDINIYFMGTRPFWRKKRGIAKEIHEYQSLSTPPYARQKDLLKRMINREPNGRIFLNKDVQKKLGFSNKTPTIYRDMGVDEAFFQLPDNRPKYDIVYAGSILGRTGLVEVILDLSKRGFKILLIGDVPNIYLEILNQPNIFLTGKVARKEIPKLYRQCLAGLNYTPDLYPFNIQTSTKTLEYLASGLHVISNRYTWIENFSQSNNYIPIWLNEISSPDNLSAKIKDKKLPNMTKYSWHNILTECNFEKFLLDSINK